RAQGVGEIVTSLADAERSHIIAALRQTNWVVGGPHGAAAQLGLPRTTLMARMQRLGIASRAAQYRYGQLAHGSLRVVGGFSSHWEGNTTADFREMEAIAG